METRISDFTWNLRLKYAYGDALAYMYLNGSLPVSTPQQVFLGSIKKTTICMHVRFLWCMAWDEPQYLKKLLLYAISDSKTVVGYLKDKKDAKPDTLLYEAEKCVVDPFKARKDDFFNTMYPFKSKDINEDSLVIARDFLFSGSKLPRIYLTYKCLYQIFHLLVENPCRNDLLRTTLECVYLRQRLDNRVLEWEMGDRLKPSD